MSYRRPNKYIVAVLCPVLLVGIILWFITNIKSTPQNKNLKGNIPASHLIAHAGGEIYGIRLTNSLQSLDNSYNKKFRLFELDFEWTSDGIPVILHDWGNANWFLNIKYSTAPHTYKDFKALKPILGLKLMDLEILKHWLLNHKDAYIITDVKKDNLKLLKLIKDNYPEILQQFIPQIYSFDEYIPIKEMGYDNIILTLYRLGQEFKIDDILNFCKNNSLYGITMDESKGFSDLPEKISQLGVLTYVHTINDYNIYVKLRDNGVFGVYTDHFEPSNWTE